MAKHAAWPSVSLLHACGVLGWRANEHWVCLWIGPRGDLSGRLAGCVDGVHGLEKLDFNAHADDGEMGGLRPQQLQHGLGGMAKLGDELRACAQQALAGAQRSRPHAFAQLGDALYEGERRLRRRGISHGGRIAS